MKCRKQEPVLFCYLVAFSAIALLKVPGKELWLQWRRGVNIPHLDIDSDQNQSDPGVVPWENLCFWGCQMPCFTAATLILKGEKEKLIVQKVGERKGRRCLAP